MKQLVPVMLVFALLLAACGGGNEGPPINRPIARFEPDYSTPEGATETYAQAVETYNLELMEEVIHPDEREAALAEMRKSFEDNQKNNVTVRIEFPEARLVDESTAHAYVRYFLSKDGKENDTPMGFWVVFVKTEDDTWRYSPSRSQELTDRVREQQLKEQEHGNGGETPEDGEEPAEDDGAEDGDSSEPVD